MNTLSTERSEFKLKPISKEGIEAAIEKAEHYRLLNQPRLSESICLDVLAIAPKNQMALRILLLALTDQFQSSSKTSKQAREIANQLSNEYERLYYTGIILERLGNASLNSGNPGSDFDAFEWYIEAMELYDKANSVNTDSKNEDPILRWNTCARIIMQYNLKQRVLDDTHFMLE